MNYEVFLGEKVVHRHVDHLLKRTVVASKDVVEAMSRPLVSVDIEVDMEPEVEVEESQGVVEDDMDQSEVVGSEVEEEVVLLEEREMVEDVPELRRSRRIVKKPQWMTEEYVVK